MLHMIDAKYRLLVTLLSLPLLGISFSSNCTSAVADTLSNPVIGVIKTKSYIVTIQLDPEGTLYTVDSIEGDRLRTQISFAEIVQEFRDLQGLLERGIADDAASQLREQWQPQVGLGAFR